MKKLRIMLAAAACAVMVLTTACGENKGNSTNSGNVSAPANVGAGTSQNANNSVTTSTGTSSANSANSGDTTSAGTSSVNSANSDNGTSTSAPAESNSTADSTGLSHGTWSGTTYTSKFLGIKGDFGSDWTITSDSELASAQGISDMSAENMKSVMNSAGVVSEMMAAKADGTSVNIVIEDTSVTKTPKGDEYFTTMLSIGGQQFEAYGAAMGVDMKANVTERTVKFCGEDTRCLYIVLTADSVDIHEIQIPIFNGDYITSITFGATTKADADALLAMFTKA